MGNLRENHPELWDKPEEKSMNLLELEEVTIKWSKDRGIITNGKATTQVIKLTSEFGELCFNLHTGKDCSDDIGDMMVVITNITQLLGFTKGISECPPRGDEDQFGILRVGDYLGRLADNIIKNEKEEARTNIGNLVFQLIDLSSKLGMDLEDCWNKAYNDIKDRKGFLTPEGNFIKESDSAYNNYVDKNQLTMVLK